MGRIVLRMSKDYLEERRASVGEFCRRLADASDVEVLAIGEDGTEVPLMAQEIVITARLNEPIIATVKLFDVEMDVEAFLEGDG